MALFRTFRAWCQKFPSSFSCSHLENLLQNKDFKSHLDCDVIILAIKDFVIFSCRHFFTDKKECYGSGGSREPDQQLGKIFRCRLRRASINELRVETQTTRQLSTRSSQSGGICRRRSPHDHWPQSRSTVLRRLVVVCLCEDEHAPIEVKFDSKGNPDGPVTVPPSWRNKLGEGGLLHQGSQRQ